MKAADLAAVAGVPPARICRVKGNNILLVLCVLPAVADINVIVAAYGKSRAYIQIRGIKYRVPRLEDTSAAHGNYAALYYGDLIRPACV